ncbi:unnamed protein product, partial [Phaeothamnion confervicola]
INNDPIIEEPEIPRLPPKEIKTRAWKQVEVAAGQFRVKRWVPATQPLPTPELQLAKLRTAIAAERGGAGSAERSGKGTRGRGRGGRPRGSGKRGKGSAMPVIHER